MSDQPTAAEVIEAQHAALKLVYDCCSLAASEELITANALEPVSAALALAARWQAAQQPDDVAELRAAIKILLARDRPSTPWHHVSEKDVDGYQEFARERLKRRPQAAQQVSAPFWAEPRVDGPDTWEFESEAAAPTPTAEAAYRKWRDKMADKGVKPPMHPYHPYIDGYNDALAAEQAARQEADTKCKRAEHAN